MALLSELPQFLQPGLSNPHRPPAQPVIVDWSNPITDGLVDYNLCQQSYALEQSSNAKILTDDGPPGYNVNARTDAGFSTAMQPCSIYPTHSVVVVFSQVNFADIYAGGDALYVERPAGAQIFKIVIRSGNTLSCVYRDSAGAGLINLPLGANIDTTRNFHVGVLVKRSDTLREFYIDGNTGSTAINSGGTYNYVSPTISYDPQDGNAGANESFIHGVYTFKRALTVAEINSLQDKPFQFFKPALPTPYLVASGAPALTEIPPQLHGIDNQYATITAHRLGGVLQ